MLHRIYFGGIPGSKSAAIALLALVFAATSQAQNSTIESLTGQVTANEISSFKSAIAGLVPGNSNSGNNYAYGNSGDAMEACADMYDITKDRAILDKLLLYCDKVVSIRNTTKVMWTGNIDPVWQNNFSNTQWGCEQGDVAGHLAYCAQLIGANPSIWNLTPSLGDTNGYGATYKARALTYLAVVDATMELFYTNNFIHADEFMRTPPMPPWPDPNSANDAVPWNQVSMICAALIRGADAHSRFGDASPNIARFRKTAQANINRFFVQANVFRYTRNGKTVCKWSYSGGTFNPGDPIRYTEDCAHGGYDITQIHRARHWLPGTPVAFTNAMMVADTLMEVIRTNTPDGTRFFSRVDGTGSLTTGMKNSWAYLAEWRPDAFPALVKTGSQYYADAARRLWIKHAMANGWPESVSLGLNLPDGWLNDDIGFPAITGDATWTNGLFTLRGSGADFGPASDQLNFTSLAVPTDFTLTVRLASQANTSPLARSGIMARGGAETNSAFVSATVTPGNGLLMEYRPSNGASVVTLTSLPAVTAPCWLQLVRLGDTFTGYQSADGTNWTFIGGIDVPLTRTVAGMVVHSHNNGALNTSTFDNVSLIASGFALDANPSSPEVLPGTNTATTITVTPLNGFSSAVGLSVAGLPARVSAAFAPAVVTGGSGSSTLTLTASNNALPGAYTLTVTGTNGGLSVSTPVYLTINEPPPTNDTHVVAANNGFVLRSQSTTVQNSSEVLSVKRLNDSNTRMAYVRFNLSSWFASHSVAGTTLVKLRLYIPTATSGGGTLSVYGLVDNFNGTNGADAAWSSTTLTWNNQPAKSASPNDIPNSATALPNANAVLLGSAGIPSTAGEFAITLSLANVLNFLAADNNQQITLLFVNNSATQVNFASLANTADYLQPTLQLVSPVTDFSLGAAPSAQTVSAGGAIAFNVTVTGSNGFDGDVALSADGLPAGLTAGFDPPAITGSGSATLLFNTSTDLPPDIYVIAVTGASGGRERGATITLTVNPPDADADGVLDWWTQQYFGHPDGQAADNSRAGDDADGDGASNLAEFHARTDPTNAASYFHVLNATASGVDETISWSAIGGVSYVVQASSNLADGFYDISPVLTPPTNGPAEFVESGAATNEPARFYRVRLAP